MSKHFILWYTKRMNPFTSVGDFFRVIYEPIVNLLKGVGLWVYIVRLWEIVYDAFVRLMSVITGFDFKPLIDSVLDGLKLIFAGLVIATDLAIRVFHWVIGLFGF